MSSQYKRRDELSVAGEQRLAAGSGQDLSSRLPRPVQEDLARKLRSAYHELADKPAFLGDPAVPVEFEYHLQRLEAVEKARHTEKVRNQGIEAVRNALEDIVPGPLNADDAGSHKPPKRDE